MVSPVTPKEAAVAKKDALPAVVINVINKLIAERYTYGWFVIKQKEIVNALVEAGLDREDIFEKGYLDFEVLYEQYGWEVKYDKPAYDENYDAFFKFKGK